MNHDTIKAELKDIFHHVAPDIEFDQLDFSRPLNTQVEMDSMDFYTLLVHVHERMGVNVPDAVLRDLKNINGLIDYIEKNAK